MNGLFDEAEALRRDGAARDDAATRAEGPNPSGAPCVVAKTKAIATYPTTAAAFYGVEPQHVTGTETEGSAGTLTGTGATILALNLGTAIPPVGTQVLVTFCDWQWCFRYDG